ncbi:flagellar filament protein FlaA [Thiospirochaeta perfilievii]|uniref:Flagellar filament protein FlaA n=1 Tax=Thiospirochaeta perfilievii TaxID=252967 RepID=A0A5C1QGR8_9SPIO|nr:flagellar filament outer layer protein FlaA [Thiospirochaeta perfilievii]QEN05766.1 flagellar filament protein FlaA [Thiospirochaeta perfilievii]
MFKSSKKVLFTIIALFICTLHGYTQEGVSEPDPGLIGIESAQQSLREVSISKFEDAAFWYGKIGADDGIISVRDKAGSPSEKEAIEGEQETGINEVDEKVLGVRVDFFRRGMVDFYINPIRPLPIEGITKTVSMWVVGRNTRHTLKLIIKDHFGNYAELTMGDLNFSGWKKMVVAIPPNIVQRDYHYNDKMGIQIIGFKVECDLEETYGKYYLYFDDLRAVTDLFAEQNRDADDINDAW